MTISGIFFYRSPDGMSSTQRKALVLDTGEACQRLIIKLEAKIRFSKGSCPAWTVLDNSLILCIIVPNRNMLTDEARYHALRAIYSDMEDKLRTQLRYVHNRRDPGALEWAFKLDDWELVLAQFKHLLKTPIHYLHEEPKCPVFTKAMEYHGILEIRLRREGVNDEERADLRMYGIKCYELLMVRQMAMEAFMSKSDASHKARLEVFAEILDLASFEAKFVLKGWDGGPTGFYEKRKEFTNLLQVAMNGEADESQDQLKDFWEQFRDLHRRPV